MHRFCKLALVLLLVEVLGGLLYGRAQAQDGMALIGQPDVVVCSRYDDTVEVSKVMFWLYRYTAEKRDASNTITTKARLHYRNASDWDSTNNKNNYYDVEFEKQDDGNFKFAKSTPSDATAEGCKDKTLSDLAEARLAFYVHKPSANGTPSPIANNKGQLSYFALSECPGDWKQHILIKNQLNVNFPSLVLCEKL